MLKVFNWITLAFDMTPEMGAIFGALLGLGMFVWYILPQWVKDIVIELWRSKEK